jgi:DNA replication protein DnaC
MSASILSGPCRGCSSPTTRPVATGYGADMLNGMPLVCQGCSDAAERIDQEREEQAAARDRAVEHRNRLRASGLAESRCGWTLDKLDTLGRSRVVDVLAVWARHADPDPLAVLLMGGVGTGKTTAAAAALVERAHVSPVQWVDAHRLIRDLQAGFGTPQRESAQRLLDGGKNAPALVVDDLDKVRPTEYAAEAIFALVDSREAHRRPLLITTNLRLAELAAKWPAPFGEAIGSRLRGYCAAFELTGGDRRARPQQPSSRDELAKRRRAA